MTVTPFPSATELPDGHGPAHGQPGPPGRWQPSRAGILNVWRYDHEVLQFRRGRLLLRGPNGTGKSKALELLLPYLLDANLRPNRLSTFGGSERTMHWNLIGHGWEGTTRVGYVWMEFRRTGDDGQPVWFTCGARLSATANTRSAKAAYFTTPLRVGLPGGVSLVNADRRPLTRNDLAAAVGDTRVYDSAGEYRRVVRQALFRGFTEEQYDALITTLLQLRIPKLSEHLDPGALSRILSQALPPLDTQDVGEIAEGFEKLDRRKEVLRQLSEEIQHARTLANRQRAYTRRVLRAAAADLISATTRMDDATRALRGQREQLQRVSEQQERLQAEDQQIEQQTYEVGQRIAGLRDTDAYKQGEQLAVLRHEADLAVSRAQEARDTANGQACQVEDDEDAAATDASDATDADANARRAEDEAAAAATRVGLETSFAEARAATSADETRKLLRAAVDARERQVKEVRDALDAHAAAVRGRGDAEKRRATCVSNVDEAERKHTQRAEERADALARLHQDLIGWARGCQVLPLAGRVDELLALAEDERGLGELVGTVAGAVLYELSAREHDANARRSALDGERARHQAELAALEADGLPLPDTPPTRTADRDALPGAPLWRLVGWVPGVGDRDQARLEAALEASGLLDAWVLPGGGVRVSGHDTFAEADLTVPAAGASLADFLTVEPEATDPARRVPAQRVRALLRGITAGPTALTPAGSGQPTVPGHPAAVGTDGSWRLGPAHGTWDKPEATLIGAAARERSRQRRMAELHAAIADLDEQADRIGAELAEVARLKETLTAEQRDRPSHDGLAEATRRLAAAERDLANRQDALAAAQAELAGAEQAVTRALRTLTTTAADNGLPVGADALDSYASSLASYARQADTWAIRLRDAAAARTRADRSAAVAARSRAQAGRTAEAADREERNAEGYRVKLQQVEEAVGGSYRDTLDVIRRLEENLRGYRDRQKQITQDLRKLEGEAGQCRQQLENAQTESEQATLARDEAVAALQRLRDAGVVADASLREGPGAMDGPHATLTAAQQVAAELATTPSEPRLVKEAEGRLTDTVYAVQHALAGRADLALEPDGDGRFMLLSASVDGIRMGAAALHDSLVEEHERAAGELTDEERELFDRILTGGARRQVADRIRLADQLVRDMNEQLGQVTTASRLRVRLRWQVDPEQPDLKAARDLLLRDPASLPEADREALHRFFRERIAAVRDAGTATGWEEQLLELLDYTAWHQFAVQIDKSDGGGWAEVTRRRHAALSGGEKAIVLHLPLFAAAAAHYRSGAQAPRLILLDEVFVGVDSTNRGQLLQLLTEFDLDLVLTSDHEWCTYRELDGIAIHQLITGTDGDDAVTTARFVWNGTRCDPDDPEGMGVEDMSALDETVDGPTGNGHRARDATEAPTLFGGDG